MEYMKGNRIFRDDFFSSLVIYEKNEVCKKAKKYVPKYEKVIFEKFSNKVSWKSIRYNAAKIEFHKFYSCVKQDKFHAENECRFLIFSNRELERRIRGNSIVSFLKVQLEEQPLPITEIILSPYVDSKIFNDYSNLIRRYLDDNNYNDVEIHPSEICLRK